MGEKEKASSLEEPQKEFPKIKSEQEELQQELKQMNMGKVDERLQEVQGENME